MHPIGLKVPGCGRISAVKMGKLEREYLLTDGKTVSWLSHSDITAMLEANK